MDLFVELTDAIIKSDRASTPPNLPPEHALVEFRRTSNIKRRNFHVANLAVAKSRGHIKL